MQVMKTRRLGWWGESRYKGTVRIQKCSLKVLRFLSHRAFSVLAAATTTDESTWNSSLNIFVCVRACFTSKEVQVGVKNGLMITVLNADQVAQHNC